MFSRLATRARPRFAAAPLRRAAAATPVAAQRLAAAVAAPADTATRFGSSSSIGPKLKGYETSVSIQEVFGQDSFNERAMRDYLSKPVYEEVSSCIKERRAMSGQVLDSFAQGLMRCVLSAHNGHTLSQPRSLGRALAPHGACIVSVIPVPPLGSALAAHFRHSPR